MLRRNGPVIKSVESVVRPEESLWWERFVVEVGLSGEWKREGVMDGGSVELTEWEDVEGAWTGKSVLKTLSNSHVNIGNSRREALSKKTATK